MTGCWGEDVMTLHIFFCLCLYNWKAEIKARVSRLNEAEKKTPHTEAKEFQEQKDYPISQTWRPSRMIFRTHPSVDVYSPSKDSQVAFLHRKINTFHRKSLHCIQWLLWSGGPGSLSARLLGTLRFPWNPGKGCSILNLTVVLVTWLLQPLFPHYRWPNPAEVS